MAQNITLRSGWDRLRYTICFEAFLMAALIPLGAIVFEKHIVQIGMLLIVLSVKAMALNLAYNYVFDKLDARAGRVSSERSLAGRIAHAIGFEITLTTTSLPIYIWWLDLGILEVLAADLVVTTLVVVYTYVFTLAYDRLYPLGPLQQAGL